MTGVGLLAAAGAVGVGRATADAAAADTESVVWFTEGSLRGALLIVGRFDMGVAEVFPAAPLAVLKTHGLEGEKTVFTIRSLYLEMGERKVVIEPGGLDQTARLATAMREVGIDPAAIDTVIMTHAHMDHCAGASTADGITTFPSARYYLQRAEWDHWMAPDNPEPQHAANFRRILVPIKDRVTLLPGDGEIIPGIEAMLTPGHSPGHMVVLVGKQLAYTGDSLLHQLHVSHPEWTARWDLWPDQIVKSRRRLLARLAADGALVVSTHFPAPGCGRVRADGQGWTWLSEVPPSKADRSLR